jgi:hypothetical protein
LRLRLNVSFTISLYRLFNVAARRIGIGAAQFVSRTKRKSMQKPLMAAFAAATILSAAALATSAAAMPLAPAPLGAPSADARLLERIVNVCGVGGCSPVWTKRIRKPPADFVKRAVPITVVPANQHQNAAPIAPTNPVN